MNVNTFLLEPYNGDGLTYDQLLELFPAMSKDTGLSGKDIAENFNLFVDSELEIVYLEDSIWQFKDIERAKSHFSISHNLKV